ncbi:cyclophilin-like fold protein [Tessaracoccus sp. Y1736]
MTLRILTALALTAVAATVSACSTAGGAEVTLDLSLSTSPSMVAQLPGTLSFSDRMGTAQVARLPEALNIAGDPMKHYEAGDVGYAPVERSLVVFLTDGAGDAAADLVKVGHLDRGLSELSNCVLECEVALVSTAIPPVP